MGGGNLYAILFFGILMFVFYLCGWSVLGTVFLFLFLLAGYDSLFPGIAAALGLARAIYVHVPDEGMISGPLLIVAIILLIVDCYARYLLKEEANNGKSPEEKK
jgi:hypothetical protein